MKQKLLCLHKGNFVQISKLDGHRHLKHYIDSTKHVQ